MKIIVIDNYFNDIELYYANAKEIPLYDNTEYNNKFNKNQNWVGKRSDALSIANPYLNNILVENLKNNFIKYIEEGTIQITSCIHERNEKDNKNDWIHKDIDNCNYVGLVYLSKTNLNSGTLFFNENNQVINDVKFVQNRALFFDARYNHVGYGHHKNRLNLTMSISYI